MPSFYLRADSVGMASRQDLFSVLGFGEGEGREKENREERQSFFCVYVFLYLGFYRVLGKVFLCLFIYFFSFMFFF